MVQYLTKEIDFKGLFRTSRRIPMCKTLDFMHDYPVRTIDELKNNPQLGVFIVNARICEITSFDPWWYPLCKCNQVFDKYIGTFHCVKCGTSKFVAIPK
jgi:hypothetical protein